MKNNHCNNNCSNNCNNNCTREKTSQELYNDYVKAKKEASAAWDLYVKAKIKEDSIRQEELRAQKEARQNEVNKARDTYHKLLNEFEKDYKEESRHIVDTFWDYIF